MLSQATRDELLRLQRIHNKASNPGQPDATESENAYDCKLLAGAVVELSKRLDQLQLGFGKEIGELAGVIGYRKLTS